MSRATTRHYRRKQEAIRWAAENKAAALQRKVELLNDLTTLDNALADLDAKKTKLSKKDFDTQLAVLQSRETELQTALNVENEKVAKYSQGNDFLVWEYRNRKGG